MEILDDIENPFPKYTVTESTLRPYPIFLINYDGDANNLLIKAVPSPGYKFKIENHIAYYKSKDQYHIQKEGKKAIIFEVLQVNDIGKADGEPIQIDFSLYSVDGPSSNLLATVRSPVITVYNHSQYLPAPDIVKLIPDYCIENRIENIDAYGPLFLRKNNILECQIVEEDGRQIVLLQGKDIVRKRNCFHCFTFTTPLHCAGTVIVRCRYKNREFGHGKRLTYIKEPESSIHHHSNMIINQSDGSNFHNQTEMYFNEQTGHYSTSNQHDQYNMNMNYYGYNGVYEGLRYAFMMTLGKIFIDKVDQYGMTCLHWSVLGGSVKCVRLLLEKGANPNIVSKFSETPLHIACKLGNSEIASLLMEYDSIIDIKTPNKMTILHSAVLGGNHSIVKLILDTDEGLDLVSEYDDDMHTPLHYAVFKGHFKIANLLLKYADNIGEDLFIGDTDNMTPLHWAVALGEIECVREFLSVSDERVVNLKDTSGRTPLFYSVLCSNVEICRELLYHKADPNAQDKLQETPLFSAVSNNNQTIVSLLLEHGADPNILNVNNEKPFQTREYLFNSYEETSINNDTQSKRELEDQTQVNSTDESLLLDEFSSFELSLTSKGRRKENYTPTFISSMPKLQSIERENESLKSTIQLLEKKIKSLEQTIHGIDSNSTTNV